MRKVKRSFALLLSLVLLCTLFAACGSTAEPVQTAPVQIEEAQASTPAPTAEAAAENTETVAVDRSKELRIAITDTMSTLEVTNGKDSGILMEQACVIETLVGVDANFNIYAKLATDWERVNDLTWEFRLRQGVTFHDGTPFNASAVEWDLNLICANNDSFRNSSKIDTVEAVDEYTVRITTTVPTTDLPANLTAKNSAIIAPTSYDADGNFVKPIGTGYFQFESFDATESKLSVVVYENYWGGAQNSSVYRRIVRSIPDAGTRALAASNNEIDIACDIPFSEIEALSNDTNLTVLKYSTARNYQIGFNQNNSETKGYLLIPEVRKAMLHAVNRQEIVDTLLFGVGSEPNGIFMDAVPWLNTEVDTYAYNPELAAAMLDEAGLVDTDNDGFREYQGQTVKVVLICTAGRPGAPLIAQAMAGYFEEIGLQAEAQVLDGNTMSEVRKSGEYDISFNSVGTCIIPTASSYMSGQYYTGSYTAKNIGYSNPDLDALLDLCAAAETLEEKYELSRQAQAAAQDDAVICTILNYGAVFILNSKLTGFDYSPAVHDFIVPLSTDISD